MHVKWLRSDENFVNFLAMPVAHVEKGQDSEFMVPSLQAQSFIVLH
jgi:hypothetical protein